MNTYLKGGLQVGVALAIVVVGIVAGFRTHWALGILASCVCAGLGMGVLRYLLMARRVI